MKVRLSARRSADARCAFCHDALSGAIASCPRCATAFHKDCRGHLPRCPTLGCGTVFTNAPDVEIEGDVAAPSSLAVELLFERLGPLAVLVGLSAWLAGLFATIARDQLIPIAPLFAIGIAWAAWTLLRDLGFYRALPGLLRREPARLPIEIHGELRAGSPDEEGTRIFVAHLLRASGPPLRLDLDPVFGSPPGWLFALRPGTVVDVFDAGSGPVAIRTHDGHVYAVPARRVRR